LVILVLVSSACEDTGASTPGATGSAGSGSAVAAAPVKPQGGGFSADLAKKLDTAGSASDTPERTPGGSAVEDKPAADVKSGSAPAPADVKVEPKPADTKVEPAKVEPAKVEPAKVEPAKVEPAKVEPAKTGSAAGTAPKIDGNVVISTTPSKGPVNTPAELKAINISLLPNWERDVASAGTISLAVKVPGKADIATFVFHYGIEDAKAPADRDAYKKWLADNKLFISKDDRQKGAAWYLEGVDGKGKGAFRMVVIYGGKKLICYGSLYKDSALGDLRDQTIIQAKQICETLTL
jgi:hypothetical protein